MRTLLPDKNQNDIGTFFIWDDSYGKGNVIKRTHLYTLAVSGWESAALGVILDLEIGRKVALSSANIWDMQSE